MSFGDVEFSFFKQKTAYEMRISDWSSDVCSSDLPKVGGTDFRVLTYEVKGGPEVAAAGAGAGAGDPAKAAEAKDFARLCLNELVAQAEAGRAGETTPPAGPATPDRKSTRLNSSH